MNNSEPFAAESSVGGPITRGEVLSRAGAWLNNRAITYSMEHTYPDPQGRHYRRDCSGYASMALHASESYDTVSFVNSGAVSLLTGKDQLEPGDLVGILGRGTHGASGHVMIFVAWNDSARSNFTVYEHGGPPGPNYPHQSTYRWPYQDHRGMFKPYRYKKIIPSVPQIAFQANTGRLFTTGLGGTRDLELGMMKDTSPSIAAVPNGYVIAFQANTGRLFTTGLGGTRDLELGMMAGTSPSIV